MPVTTNTTYDVFRWNNYVHLLLMYPPYEKQDVFTLIPLVADSLVENVYCLNGVKYIQTNLNNNKDETHLKSLLN